MVKRSKRYKAAMEMVSADALQLEQAVEVLSNMPKVKFDETVQLSVKILLEAKQSNMSIRGTVALPNGSGKEVKVLVFTENAQDAIAAGADHAGLEDILKQIDSGWLDFDVAISTTSAMKEVRKAARVLGPRGLMPNPKSGTVTDDIADAIKQVKAGRVEFKMDKTGNVSIIIGKRSFDNDKLVENAKAAMAALVAAKPENFKGRYITNVAISATMTPSLTVTGAVSE